MRKLSGTNIAAIGRRYRHDLAFRGNAGIHLGIVLNFFYAIFRMAVGIHYASVWFLSMAVYYLVLGMIRLALALSYRRRTFINEWRCYRRTAWQLFLLNIPMGGMIVLMVLSNSGFFYPGYIIYLSAMYTFCTMTMAVVNLRRFRKLGSPILSAAKALNFVAAMMSVLGLQTAMIAQFDANDEGFRRTMNAVTGLCVWVLVILTAIFMLHRSKRTEGENP